LPRAIESGLEFAPGTRFFSNLLEDEPFMRVNLAARTENEIVEGIRRLAKVIMPAQSDC
jgi:DNA-binding transcriptional MocR family regulator